MYQTANSLIIASAENSDSMAESIIGLMIMVPIIAALLWWLEKTNQNERDETKRKRR